MNCKTARRRLTAGEAGAAGSHVERCDACTAFARRLASVERALGEHHLSTPPPPGFAARLRERLPREDDLLGWAALRLLPATLCLVLLLSWLNLNRPANEAPVATDATGAVLSWVLDPSTEVENGS